jgi:glycosyltransferase involved in cell wall biosynthesis
MNATGQTICLNMIVKNEAPVIRRCLEAVRPIIDHWVIVDTGSIDGTQDLIREVFRDVPGELHERPWRNFAHNRSEALALARGHGDYVFVIDGDEVLEIAPDFVMPSLTHDSYNLRILYGGCSYLRKQMVRNALPWRYEGVVHEYITCELARNEAFLPGLQTVPHHDGARARDASTYRRDALMLEQALIEEPNNTRSVFYLAQSYRDAGDLELALRHYKRRVDMGGWPEEVWFSLYQIGQIRERLQHPWPEVLDSYLHAWQYDATRCGPLYRVAMHYQAKGEYQTAHIFLARAMQVPKPGDNRLFVEQTIYDFQLSIEYAVAAYYVGQHAEAIATNNALLRSGRLPPQAIAQVIRNRRFSVDALFPKKQGVPASGRLHVLMPCGAPGSEFDDGVDSLLRQDGVPFVAAVLHDASADLADRVSSADARVSFVPAAPADGALRRIETYVRRHCSPDDLVAVLAEGCRLDGADTLRRIKEMFDDADCLLAYGQFRTAAGALGAAEPAPSERAFLDHAATFFNNAPVAFRARLLQDPASRGAWRDLFAAAGFAGTRFSDDVWVVQGAPAAAPARAAARSAAKVVLPRISCLMVTYDRLTLAKCAIRSFAAQSYPEKELIIVSDGEERFRRALERYVAALALNGVRFVYPGPERRSLGHLRNLSVEAAAGDLICQWDDDDYSHPDRLMRQAEELIRNDAGACLFTDHLHFIEEKGLLSWVDWSLGRETVSGAAQLLPGTLMMRRDPRFRYPEDGPYARQGEDSVLLDDIYRAMKVAHLRGAGYMYLYTFHGRNTFSREHHYRLSSCCMPVAYLQEHADRLREAVTHYPIPRPCFVIGRDGPAFAFD